MPSEVMRDITLRRVTPASGEEALGKWRAPYRNHGLDSEPGSSGNLNGCHASPRRALPLLHRSYRLMRPTESLPLP